MSAGSIVSMWFKPRKGVNYLQASPLSQLLIIAGLCLLYFIQVSLFILLMDNYDTAPLLTVKGLVLAVCFLLFLAVGSFVIVQASTLAIWMAAKCFNGEGTLPQTRAAVVWTLIGSSPIGFFWILLYLAYSKQHFLGKAAGVIGAIAYIGALATLIYMLIVMLITISETHRFGRWRAFFTTAFGAVILTALIYALIWIYNLFSR